MRCKICHSQGFQHDEFFFVQLAGASYNLHRLLLITRDNAAVRKILHPQISTSQVFLKKIQQNTIYQQYKGADNTHIGKQIFRRSGIAEEPVLEEKRKQMRTFPMIFAPAPIRTLFPIWGTRLLPSLRMPTVTLREIATFWISFFQINIIL